MEHEGKMTCKFYADNIIEDCKHYQGKPIGASCIGCREKCVHAVSGDFKPEDFGMNRKRDEGP